jgi:hypothetical protein
VQRNTRWVAPSDASTVVHVTRSSDFDNSALTAMLSKLQVGEIPSDVFHQIARLMVLPAVEIIPLRMVEGAAHVLMTQRESSDPVWPNLWHTPGRILRPSEVDGSGTPALVFERLMESELPGVAYEAPVFVRNDYRTVRRSAEFAALYWAAVDDAVPATGTLFPVDDLPDQIIDHHVPMIREVAAHFLTQKTTRQ